MNWHETFNQRTALCNYISMTVEQSNEDLTTEIRKQISENTQDKTYITI